KDEHYIFADCSLNRTPDTDELVEIALQAAETAKTFQLEPRVALLSYSTHGSGSGTDVDKVREAAERLQRMPLDYAVDGERQVDCALSARVAKLKAVDSIVGGNANILIFPDLNAGNIGYKLV
ncbi:phosphate acetyltransferase, partial [Erysipelatoclostridium ramosum]|uniref:phosphate acyltransferase n=1 Tax=Thomasclavelia ramosa TaxID=1547 RepID=UPI002223BFBF